MRMHGLGVRAVDLRILQKGISEMRYRVDLYGDNGEKITESSVGVRIGLICNIENTEDAKLYCDTQQGREYIDFAAAENTVLASILCGTDYRLELRYTVTVSENKECTVTVNTDTARPGELVSVSVVAHGSTIKLTRLTVTDSDGNEIEVGADGTFRMPHSNVTVMQHTELKYHTVTFVASGKTVSTYKVLHGTAVTPPQAPAIQADNLYTYEFERWYPRSGIIVTDTVFTAVYKRTLIPHEPDTEGLKVTDGVLKLIVLGAVACGLFVCGVVPAAVILTVNLKRRGKLFNKKEK